MKRSNWTLPHVCLVRMSAEFDGDGGLGAYADITYVDPDSMAPVPGLKSAREELYGSTGGLSLFTSRGAREHRLVVNGAHHVLDKYQPRAERAGHDEEVYALVHLTPAHVLAAFGEEALLRACAVVLGHRAHDYDDLDIEAWARSFRLLGASAQASLAAEHSRIARHLTPDARAVYEELHPMLAAVDELL